MLKPLSAISIVIVTALCGCNSTLPRTSGAGFDVRIVSATLDTAGYNIAVKVTNIDTVVLEYGGCSLQLEFLQDGTWESPWRGMGCELWLRSMAPGNSRTFLFTALRLDRGQQVRF